MLRRQRLLLVVSRIDLLKEADPRIAKGLYKPHPDFHALGNVSPRAYSSHSLAAGLHTSVGPDLVGGEALPVGSAPEFRRMYSLQHPDGLFRKLWIAVAEFKAWGPKKFMKKLFHFAEARFEKGERRLVGKDHAGNEYWETIDGQCSAVAFEWSPHNAGTVSVPLPVIGFSNSHPASAPPLLSVVGTLLSQLNKCRWVEYAKGYRKADPADIPTEWWAWIKSTKTRPAHEYHPVLQNKPVYQIYAREGNMAKTGMDSTYYPPGHVLSPHRKEFGDDRQFHIKGREVKSKDWMEDHPEEAKQHKRFFQP
eukprot:gene994-2606_t